MANKLTKWKIDIKGMAGMSGIVDETGVVSSKGEQKRVVGVWDEEIKKQIQDKEDNGGKEEEKKDILSDEDTLSEDIDNTSVVE